MLGRVGPAKDGIEMRLDSNADIPNLLMLSDCFPDPDGPVKAARAWRLLACAATTHRVYLSAIADRPVNLQLWRRVDDLTQRIQIIGMRKVRTTPNPFTNEAVAWTRQTTFDTLLVNAPAAWPTLFPVGIGSAICDMGSGDVFDSADASKPMSFLAALRSSRKQTSVDDILAACDRVTLAGWNEAWQLPRHRWKVRLLPDDNMQDAWARLLPSKPRRRESLPQVTVLPAHTQPLRRAA